MSPTQVVLPGTVKPDGTLELSQPLSIPPGPVEVTVRPLARPREATWEMLERIWAARRARGAEPRTSEEIDAEINALRDESEERLRQIERLDSGPAPC